MRIVWMVLFTLVAMGYMAPAQAQTFDHLTCYKVKDRANFKADVDLIALQEANGFAPGQCALKGKAKFFCAPTDKSVVGFTDPKGTVTNSNNGLSGPGMQYDQLCYKVKCSDKTGFNGATTVVVTDQFGTRDLEKFKVQMLCTPTLKGDGTPPGTTTTTTLPVNPPVCGDGVVNQAAEQCDGGDDPACPGACRANCSCPIITKVPVDRLVMVIPGPVSNVSVVLQGEGTIRSGPPVGNDPNTFQIEMVQMELVGSDPFLGEIRVQMGLPINPLPPVGSSNTGQGSFQVDSFFDVFFDVEFADVRHSSAPGLPPIHLSGPWPGGSVPNGFTMTSVGDPNGGCRDYIDPCDPTQPIPICILELALSP